MKSQLKWYHCAAKAILIAITIPIFPILILIALSMRDHPLAIYRDMWYD